MSCMCHAGKEGHNVSDMIKDLVAMKKAAEIYIKACLDDPEISDKAKDGIRKNAKTIFGDL